MLIRLPLSLFVATLVMACTPQGKPAAVADKAPASAPTPASDKAAICRAKCMAAVDAPEPVAKPKARPHRPRVHRVVHQPRVIKGSGRVAYASEGPRGGAYGGAYGARYAGASVSVTETSSSSARYRYSDSEARWGSRSATYASGGSAVESRYGPPPATAGAPIDHPRGPSGQLAGITRDGALTWPGKVEY